MKLTIIPDDKAVYKDHVCFLDLTFSCPNNVNALQWNESKQEGWIEFKPNEDGSIPENETINSLPSWVEGCLNAWNEADYNIKNPPPPSDEALLESCKSKAKHLLKETDWVELPSVTDETQNKYLLNQSEFLIFRSQVRALAINPITNAVFPAIPVSVWSS
jgi:hypothetical protein